MAKYHSGRLYGDGLVYAGSPGADPSGSVQHIFMVDWNNDGTFESNEGAYIVDLSIIRGQANLVTPSGGGFEKIQPGQGTITLENSTGRFDPDNVSGALYGKLLPGRKFRYYVKDLTTKIMWPVMAGIIYDIPAISESDRVELLVRGSMTLLDRNATLPTAYQSSIRNAITDTLAASRFSNAFGAIIDAEDQRVSSFDVNNQNALTVLQDLAAASLGQIFDDNRGAIRFYARGHATMPTIEIDEAQCLKSIRRSTPWENQRSAIQANIIKFMKGDEEVAYELPGPMIINGVAVNSGNTTIRIGYGGFVDVRLAQILITANSDGSGMVQAPPWGTSYQMSLTSVSVTDKQFTMTVHSYTGQTYLTKLVLVGRKITQKEIPAFYPPVAPATQDGDDEILYQSGLVNIAAGATEVISGSYAAEVVDARLQSLIIKGGVNGVGTVVYPNSYLGFAAGITIAVDNSGYSISIHNIAAYTICVTTLTIIGKYATGTRATVNGDTLFYLASPYLQDINHGTAFTKMIYDFLRGTRRTIEITIEQRPELQYSFDLLDKIHFTSQKLGIDTNLHAGRIEHRWNNPSGQSVNTKLIMIPRLTDGTAIDNDPFDPFLPWIPVFDPTIPPVDPPIPPTGEPTVEFITSAFWDGTTLTQPYTDYATYLGSGVVQMAAPGTENTKGNLGFFFRVKWNGSSSSQVGQVMADWEHLSGRVHTYRTTYYPRTEGFSIGFGWGAGYSWGDPTSIQAGAAFLPDALLDWMQSTPQATDQALLSSGTLVDTLYQGDVEAGRILPDLQAEEDRYLVVYIQYWPELYDGDTTSQWKINKLYIRPPGGDGSTDITIWRNL